MGDHSPYLTVAEAAELLQVNRKSVYDMVKRGELDHLRVGQVKGIRVTRASIDRLVKSATPIDT
jgi:excisionase family DNA binding protein